MGISGIVSGGLPLLRSMCVMQSALAALSGKPCGPFGRLALNAYLILIMFILFVVRGPLTTRSRPFVLSQMTASFALPLYPHLTSLESMLKTLVPFQRSGSSLPAFCYHRKSRHRHCLGSGSFVAALRAKPFSA